MGWASSKKYILHMSTYVCIPTGNMDDDVKSNQFLGGSMASNGDAFIVSSMAANKIHSQLITVE